MYLTDIFRILQYFFLDKPYSFLNNKKRRAVFLCGKTNPSARTALSMQPYGVHSIR